MKTILHVVLLVAAATAAVVSNEVPNVMELPDVADGYEVADENVNDMPDVIVIDADELVDVADMTDVAEETAVASRRSLSLGSIGNSDVRVANSEHRVYGVAGRVQRRDIIVNTSRRISAIRVNRVGASQNATPSIVNGGIGASVVRIRLTSALGRGFHYRIQVYAR